MISDLTPEHSGEEPRITWLFDSEAHTIDIDLFTTYEENSSCSCHPEWQTLTHSTLHSIPADELLIGIDQQVEENAHTYVEHFDARVVPYLKVMREKRDAEKAAHKEREAQEARNRYLAQQRATELRERAERDRLLAKYPTK